jgi:RimJ/RimL family protein N-acetyltransferase
MCNSFYNFSNYSKYRDIDLSKTKEMVDWYFQQPQEQAIIILLVYESTPVGMISALRAPMPFWPGFVAAEQVWWVDEKHRGRHSLELLKALVYWAELVGLSGVTMTSLESNPKVGRLYKQLGFTHVENAYFKYSGV